jgi:hypothetical protein
MHLEVDTEAVRGLADAVRDAATAVTAVTMPRPPVVEDVAAADAIGALLDVCAERIDACAAALRSGAVLLETARQDYARTEARASAAATVGPESSREPMRLPRAAMSR